MSTLALDAPFTTHQVTNQVPPREELDEYALNTPLTEAVARHGADWATDELHDAGRMVGSAQYQEWARLANEHPPVLRTHDRWGNRIDEVEYHPAYHDLMRRAIERGIHSLPWRDPQPAAHTARAALSLLGGQVEAGHGCPISMTYSAVPALRATPEVAAEWEPRLTARAYDPVLRPASEKPGAICGMAMTEKQGGSDVRANTTRARALNGGGSGAEYELVGHKWFCSAPMSDLFLVLAQADEGLSCFALPRILPDGTRNAFRIQRLKDKLGNRSNASSEVEFHGAWARMVGEPGRGVPTIIEMVNHTRLDCVLGSAAGMRQSVVEATWHAAHRAAFGHTLVDQPLMLNVLADLCLESEAATLAGMRLAAAYDAAADDEAEQLFKRLATAVVKYWVCKRGPNHAYEALECQGGNGYIEAGPMARRYREQPLLSIWEGSGNVIALDVLRALARTPAALEAFLGEVEQAAGADPRLDRFTADLRAEFADLEGIETRARRIVERMALALQGSLVVRYSPPAVADAFCAARLERDSGLEYGTLPAGVDAAAIVARHAPQAA